MRAWLWNKPLKTIARLDCLTSLRFFAAGMIVFHHSISLGLFGLGSTPGESSIFGQGVSFFFVLSGFILAYVYQRLETWPKIFSFYRARVARVWPALVFSFFLTYWLLSLEWDTPIALANLFMVNAWIPVPEYFFSYNIPSWSISTEFFFYLLFPVLIYKWEKYGRARLLFSMLIVLIFCYISNTLQHSKDNLISAVALQAGLIYVNPLTRVLEFILGIFVCSIWRNLRDRVQWRFAQATLYELLAVVVCALSVYYVPKFAWSMMLAFNESAITYWLIFGGSMLSFSWLIYVMAIGKGWISRILSSSAPVLMGEISFSLYLVHLTLLRYYHENFSAFPVLPHAISMLIFWAVLLLVSYLMWALVEMPCRRLILGRDQAKVHGTNVLKETWHHHLNWNRKTVLASAMLISLLLSINLSMDQSAAVDLKRKNIPVDVDTLVYYAGTGNSKVINWLLQAGIDVNARNSKGTIALTEAAWAGNDEVVSMLLTAGAKIEAKNANGLTALKAAVSQQQGVVALLLLDRGASPHFVDADGTTLLMDAAWQGNLALVKKLLERGVDPNQRRPTDGMTALLLAKGNRHTDVAQYLMSAGASGSDHPQ